VGLHFFLRLYLGCKWTRVAETIIAEDSGASLHQCIAELEAEKEMLQRAVDNGIEDYDLLLEGNKSLLLKLPLPL
jgi:hypothetical protein